MSFSNPAVISNHKRLDKTIEQKKKNTTSAIFFSLFKVSPLILCFYPLWRYGLLQAASQDTAPGDVYSILPSGTDLIATMADGSVASYDAGDISWILTCTALVWYVVYIM